MPYTVLIVDDDQSFREELHAALSDDYRILEADNGQAVLTFLEQPHEIDVIILDVILPDVKGTQLLYKIRALDVTVGVIILTGYSSKDIAIEALQGKADNYLEKPVNLSNLHTMIQTLLEHKQFDTNMMDEDYHGKIERIKLFADRNYDKKITLTHAAELVGLSPKYLSRIFKREVGMGFSDYRLQQKITKAKEMLASSRRSITQISQDLGYQNLETFIRLFKRFLHQTPAVYRQQQRKTNKAMH